LSGELLIDNSAWARLSNRLAPAHREAAVADLIEARRLAICTPFLLEAGYSARDASHHSAMLKELSPLPRLPIDDAVESRAVDAQGQLARSGHHRLPLVDLLIAAIADCNEVGILHYDADYDRILERTDLRFESVWLAERGSL
jgi:predicted nucleic acid-binding protein